jgi:hypothetical protein
VKEFTPELQALYNKTRKQLFSECKQLIVMPQTLRELMHRPFEDLGAIFKSQTMMYQLCGEIEDIMDGKRMGEGDSFVPLIHFAPVIRRDLESFDRSIYDVESFNDCMLYEAEVTERKQEQRYQQVHGIIDKERKWGETHFAHPSKPAVTKRFEQSGKQADLNDDGDLASRALTMTNAPSTYAATQLDRSLGSSGQAHADSDAGRSDGEEQPLRSFPKHIPEADAQKQQAEPPKRPSKDQEAKEDAKLGKMTYSFSHILDG